MDERVRKAVQHMETEIETRVTVSGLAAQVGLSVSHLTRLFVSEIGVTPGAFLRRLRLSRARALIGRTSLSVAEVMARVGITDRSHFARDFRREYGLSPRMLRVQLRRTRTAGKACG